MANDQKTSSLISVLHNPLTKIMASSIIQPAKGSSSKITEALLVKMVKRLKNLLLTTT